MRGKCAHLLPLIVLGACEGAPTGVATNSEAAFVSLKAGSHGTCALTRDGTLFCWGAPGVADAGSIPREVPGHLTVTDFTVGNGYGDSAVCAAATDGGTYCWGSYAQWNDVYLSYGPQPALLQDTMPLGGLAAGEGQVCGIASDGSANCWGSSMAGKRGEGSPELQAPNLTINRVSGGLHFRSLAAAYKHTCGLTIENNVYCWGAADELGDTVGSFTTEGCHFWPLCAWTPVGVRSIGSVASLAIGAYQSCVVLQAGTVMCWQSVQTGNTVVAGFPAVVSLPEHAVQVSPGAFHTCALGISGKVYCWGWPGPWRGTQLGSLLVEVKTALRFVSISAGAQHTCGLVREGIAYCWGENGTGQLGDGTHTTSSSPVRVRFD